MQLSYIRLLLLSLVFRGLMTKFQLQSDIVGKLREGRGRVDQPLICCHSVYVEIV